MLLTKYRHSIFITIFFILFSYNVIAANPNTNNNSYFEKINIPNKSQINTIKKTEGFNEDQSPTTLEINEADLLKNKDLLSRAIISAILTEDINAIHVLLPIYNKSEDKKEVLILQAEALQYTNQMEFKKSISCYRKLLSIYPNSIVFKMKLALNFSYDYQNIEAIETFTYIKNNFNLTTSETNLIESLISQIENRDSLSFSGGIAFIRDRNLNQVTNQEAIPIKGGYLIPPKREKGKGFSFNFEIKKNKSLSNNLYLLSGFETYGKFFIDNKSYNDITSRIYVGSGFKDAVLNINVKPFFEQRWFSNKPYMKKSGANIDIAYNISSNIQVSSYSEYGEKRYISQYDYLNGSSYLTFLSLLYIPSEKKYITFGVGKNYEKAEDKSDQYKLNNFRLGLGNNWTKNLSTYTGFSFSKRNYAEPFAFFDKRRDYEYRYNISIWDKRISYLGMIPKVTFLYEKNKSNNPLFNYSNRNILISIDKLL